MSGNCYEGTPTILESPVVVVSAENTTNRRSSFAPNFNKVINHQNSNMCSMCMAHGHFNN